jgi:hypothetical protein
VQIKAIIENGRVVNLIVHESGFLTLPEGQMYVNIGAQQVNIGDTYDYVTGLFHDRNGQNIMSRVQNIEWAVPVIETIFKKMASEGKIDDATILENNRLFPIWDLENSVACKCGELINEVMGDGCVCTYRATQDISPEVATTPPSKSELYQQICNCSDEAE